MYINIRINCYVLRNQRITELKIITITRYTVHMAKYILLCNNKSFIIILRLLDLYNVYYFLCTFLANIAACSLPSLRLSGCDEKSCTKRCCQNVKKKKTRITSYDIFFVTINIHVFFTIDKYDIRFGHLIITVVTYSFLDRVYEISKIIHLFLLIRH